MHSPLTPPDRDEMAELQKTYSEAILRTSRFIVSTLTILVILTVIVEQEIREYNREEQKLSRDINNATKSLTNAKRELQKIYSEIRKFLEQHKIEIDDTTQLELARLPKPKVHVDDLDGVEALVQEERKLEGELNKLEPSVNRERKKNETQKEKRESQRKQKQSSRPHTATIVKQEQQSSDKLQSQLEMAVNLLNRYKAFYHEGIIAARKVITKGQEKEKLKANKKSMPTPFGSFDVLPRLALLALAFAVLLSYFSFYLSILQIHALARDYNRAREGQKMISLRSPAPFWLYGTEPDLEQVFFWRRGPRLRLLSSLTLHAVWLILAGWLVWECVSRWKSAEELLFDYKHVWSYTLIICFVASVALAVWQFAPPQLRNIFLRTKHPLDTSRRALVRFSIFTFLAVATGGVGYFYFTKSAKSPKRDSSLDPDLVSDSATASWVANRSTQVVHLTSACRNHLPSEGNRIAFDKSQSGFHIHSGYELRILDELAKGARKDKSELAIKYLRQAIDLSPFSYHLYDRLIGVYGQLRRYDEITSLLQSALQRTKNEIVELNKAEKIPIASKKFKQLERAEKEFQSRIDTSKTRTQPNRQ